MREELSQQCQRFLTATEKAWRVALDSSGYNAATLSKYTKEVFSRQGAWQSPNM